MIMIRRLLVKKKECLCYLTASRKVCLNAKEGLLKEGSYVCRAHCPSRSSLLRFLKITFFNQKKIINRLNSATGLRCPLATESGKERWNIKDFCQMLAEHLPPHGKQKWNEIHRNMLSTLRAPATRQKRSVFIRNRGTSKVHVYKKWGTSKWKV